MNQVYLPYEKRDIKDWIEIKLPKNISPHTVHDLNREESFEVMTDELGTSIHRYYNVQGEFLCYVMYIRKEAA